MANCAKHARGRRSRPCVYDLLFYGQLNKRNGNNITVCLSNSKDGGTVQKQVEMALETLAVDYVIVQDQEMEQRFGSSQG